MLISQFTKLFIIMKNQLNLIIFLIFALISEIYTANDPLQGSYPNSLLFQNGKLFIANYNGFHVYDKALQTSSKSQPYSSIEINEEKLSKTLIAQFPSQNGMIICLVPNTVFFLDSEGEVLFSDNIPSYDYTYAYFNLLTYKKDGDYYYYIISFIKDYTLYILYYKASSTNNELIREIKFKPFYFDFPNVSIKEYSLGCQIMNSSNKGKVLTCCFQATNGNFIVIQSFIIEKNFEVIGEDVYARVESPDARIIHTTVSEEGKNLVAFYRDNNGAGYYFVYNIDNNTVIKNEPLIKSCVDIYIKFKLFYIKESGEYVFACTNNERGFTIMRMDLNFTIINSNKFSDVNYNVQYVFNTFSIFYDSDENKYAILIDLNTDGSSNSLTYKIGKYYITIDFNSDYNGGSPPNPYQETLPSTSTFYLPSENQYYVNTKEFYRPVTTNEQNGIVINFLSTKNPLILDKNNETIKKEIYGINIEGLPEYGQLKYIINGELKDVELNKRIFGEFKFYYKPGKYDFKTKIIYRIYLRNYSIASSQSYYWLVLCKANCSCTTDTSTCSSCADGYGFYRTSGNPFCVNGTEFCSNRFYSDKSSFNLQCMNEEENECPPDYPYYNEYTRECRQNIPQDNDDEDEIPPFTESTNQAENAEDSINDKSETESESSSESLPDNPEEPDTESSSESSPDNPEDSNSESTGQSSPDNPEDSNSESTGQSLPDNPEESTSESAGYSSPDNPKESTSQSTSESSPNNPEKSESSNSEALNSENSEESEITEKNNFIDLNSIKGIMDLIKEETIKEIIELILGHKNLKTMSNSESLKELNKTHQILSALITSGSINMSSGREDIILKGEKIIYQITNTENQKNSDDKSEISIIDLGECEKIIKKNISYKEDPTPLIILKIDIQKEGFKASAVQYEVYNPYTNEKIDLNICSNAIIKISAPVNLTSDEVETYEDLKKQGYDLYDAKGSFYQEICTQFTSKNSTDVILSDRRRFYYDKNATFCEESCTYQGINTESEKVICYCQGQKDAEQGNSDFDKEKFFENFYKVKDYTNYQVLYCYKLVFSAKGLIRNISFYIFIVLVLLFLVSMIINLLKALKKIDEIIFKIFQDKFMFEIMQNIIRSKKNEKKEIIDINDNKEDVPKTAVETNKKLNIFQNLRLKYKKSTAPQILPNNNNNMNNNNNNMDNNNDLNNNDKIYSSKNIVNIINNNNKNIGINIINDINKYNNIVNNHRYNDNINDTSNNINSKDKKLPKIKNMKMNDVNNKKNVNFRMNCKIDYSNFIRDKNFSISNIFDEIIKKDDKLTSSKYIKNKEEAWNALESSMNTKNITNLNNIYYENTLNISNNRVKKFYKKNISNDLFSNNNNINSNNYSNPPLKTNKSLLNNITANRIKNKQIENIYQDSSSSDKKTFFKKSLNYNTKRKSKTKIYRKPQDILGLKSKKILCNNSQLINTKNDETTSKNQLRLNFPLINEKIQEKQNVANQNKIMEKSKEEQKPKKNSKYIDAELNNMDYENALIYDQREYCQYYVSLLKKKQLILLVFISNDDYNVFLLKFSLLILSLALFYALNTFFFKDSTMRYIFTNEGRYNFLYQIPQILYSTLISFVMTYILKILSLSQNDLIEVKKESDRTKAKKMAANSKKCLAIKLYLFFFIGMCLIIFFWYYTSAFSAVYPNTQLHLIKDILISFGISMIYPFLINIVPGFLRIPSLKAKNKNRKCLYIISKLIAIF